MFCVTPCEPEPDGKVVQAYKLTLYPTPQDTYLLSGRCVAVPPRLSDDNPFPMGGHQHAETIRTAVLMAAELRHIQVKPPTPFGRGRRVWIPRPQQEEFNDRLQASIGMDAKLKPDSLGMSGEGPAARLTVLGLPRCLQRTSDLPRQPILEELFDVHSPYEFKPSGQVIWTLGTENSCTSSPRLRSLARRATCRTRLASWLGTRTATRPGTSTPGPFCRRRGPPCRGSRFWLA